MAAVGGLVTMRLVGEVDSAPAAMKRVVAYNRQHFGDRISLEPFISYEIGRVSRLNALPTRKRWQKWERAMRESTSAPRFIGLFSDRERRVTDTSQ